MWVVSNHNARQGLDSERLLGKERSLRDLHSQELVLWDYVVVVQVAVGGVLARDLVSAHTLAQERRRETDVGNGGRGG